MRHGALSLVLSLTVGACASSNLQTDQNLNSNQSQNSNHPRDIDPNQNDMGFDSYGRPGDPLSFKDGSGNREGLTDFVERDSYLPKNSANTPVMDPPIGRQYRNSHRVTREDFIDESPDEGSLWASTGQTNYYLTKNKVRSPGDLISLVLEKDLFKEAIQETQRNLAPRERIREIRDLRDFYRERLASLTRKESPPPSPMAFDPNQPPGAAPSPVTPPPAVTPSPTPTAEVQSPGYRSVEEIERFLPRISMQDVDIAPSLDLKQGDTLMGEILERFPNGNYKIRAMKRVSYKKGPARIVSVMGIVKASDIAEETDIVNSGKLYEHHIEIAH